MEYSGKGVYNKKGNVVRVEGFVKTDTARVPNSRRVRELMKPRRKSGGRVGGAGR